MLKERVQELLDFTKSESPYRKANKSWINKDIFLDLSPSSKTLQQKNEVAELSVLWNPIFNLLTNLFFIIIVGSILVFSSLSFATGKFDFHLFNASPQSEIVKIEKNQSLLSDNFETINSQPSTLESIPDQKDIDKINQSESSYTAKMKIDENGTNNNIDNSDTKIKDLESSQDSNVIKEKKSKTNFI